MIAHEWERAEALLGERHVAEERGHERLKEERERSHVVVPAGVERREELTLLLASASFSSVTKSLHCTSGAVPKQRT